ncbi:Protein misato-like protein 1 [Bienertia sinuspersici]
MREVVTVQVGGFANFIGSHFWNFQDELLGLAGDPDTESALSNHGLNMDVLYRTGETPEGVLTYTPRLLSVNYRGSLGSMSSYGTLYNQNPELLSPVATWKGDISTQRSQPYERNLFLRSLYEEEQKQSVSIDSKRQANSQDETQDKDIVDCLENGVQYWTDFSKVHYHPQSLYELNGLWADEEKFNNYGMGKDVFAESFQGEEMAERLRFFIEECDHVQGIQYVVDDSGGFSSVAVDFLQNIADEYTNTPVLLYTVRSPDSFMNPRNKKRNISQDLHNSVSFAKLSSFCKLIVPVGLPFLGGSKASMHLRVNDEKPYHCSAVYAAALHSLSLPFRMDLLGPTSSSISNSGALDFNSLLQMLSGDARQNMVAILDATLPAPTIEEPAVESFLSKLQPLTPEISEDMEDVHSVESLVIHGALGPGERRASVSKIQQAIDAAYEQSSFRPRFCHLSAARCPLPIPLPFPSIFSANVGNRGQLLSSPGSNSSSKGSLDVHSIPMAARLRSSSAVLPFLSNRLENLRKFGVQRGALGGELLKNWGFEKEELEDMSESLASMVKALDPYTDVSSDSD